MIADLSIMEDSLTTPSTSESLDKKSEKLENAKVALEEKDSQSEGMKLVVRSPYWGRILKGKSRRNYDNGGMPGIPYRVIGCQAVLSAVEGQYWGCCPEHGKRVLELKEHHFMDHYDGNWDIYMVGSHVAPQYQVHAFFLLPREQTIININYKIATEGWSFIGSAHTSVLRVELEGLLGDILTQNESMGYHHHHVHLEILMNQVFDRETPRSRRLTAVQGENMEQTRPTRGAHSAVTPQSIESGATDRNFTTMATSAPPIPQVVSNDASWLSDTASTHSTSTFASSAAVAPTRRLPRQHYQHPRTHPPSTAGAVWCYPSAYQPTWASGHHDPGVTFIPASMTAFGQEHAQAPTPQGYPNGEAPILSSMSAIQQMLHQGYGGNTVLPTFDRIPSPYGSLSHLPHHPATPYVSGYPAADNFTVGSEYSYFAPPLSHSYPPGDDGEEGVLRADEKYSEEVATASISETTQEEDEEVVDRQRSIAGSPSCATAG